MICPACLRPLLPTQERTAITAAGRRLFEVHSGACAQTVDGATRDLGQALFHKVRQVLARKHPVISTMVENMAAIRRGDS
jgi:hypothetical protein